jgi:hypothetical protein
MRSARPEDKTVSVFGSKTENFREELPLLITSMGVDIIMAPNFQVYAKTWLRFARLLPMRTSHRLRVSKSKNCSAYS